MFVIAHPIKIVKEQLHFYWPINKKSKRISVAFVFNPNRDVILCKMSVRQHYNGTGSNWDPNLKKEPVQLTPTL